LALLRIVTVFVAGAVAVALALYALAPPASLTVAVVLAAAGGLASGLGGWRASLLAGLAGAAGFLAAAAVASGLAGLGLVVGIGSPLTGVLVASYHVLAPATLAYALEPLARALRAASSRPQTVP